MNILGLDTCFGALSVAVGKDLGGACPNVVSHVEPMATGHAEHLVPVMTAGLAAAGLTYADLDRIVVTNGPGSFTGARIGIAAARALHLAHGTPLIAGSSLEAMALHPALDDHPRQTGLLIAVDAHRGEAYVQSFDGATRTALGPPRLVPEREYASLAAAQPLAVAGTAAGSVAAAIRAAGGEAVAITADLLPAMDRAIVRAAAATLAPGPVEPLYLRPPDAKPQEGKSLAHASASTAGMS